MYRSRHCVQDGAASSHSVLGRCDVFGVALANRVVAQKVHGALLAQFLSRQTNMEIQRPTRPFRLVIGAIWSVLLVAVLYFSWIPNPRLADDPLLPSWLGEWADTFDQLRTGVPFVFLGMLGQSYLFRQHPLPLFAGLCLFVALVEYGQTYIPRRNFDWLDIAWAVAGSAVGQSIGWGIRQIYEKSRG